eukprot:TRINITY_DN17410_c0_g1_i1.p1 TRINITY_DN17410_c0_g1~~TRINITY_DN17410_c0_g1_i1.p1  ORF type:complete len:918 (+),score=199.89 TRINITY_DN17410_c0_g1_i1:53-2806(+)
MDPPKRRRRRAVMQEEEMALMSDEGEDENEERNEEGKEKDPNDPDDKEEKESDEKLEIPKEMMAPPSMLTHKKLEAGDHVLLTVGPPEWVASPQPWHGGRPDHDRFGLDVTSTCTKGAFVKPWLRVPKGGCLNPKRRSSTDSRAWNILCLFWTFVVFCLIFGILEGDLAVLGTGDTDFLGNMCGTDPTIAPPEALLLGSSMKSRKYLWYPIDPKELGEGIENVKKYAICVTECPTFVPGARWNRVDRTENAVKQYMWDAEISKGSNCYNNYLCRNRNYCNADSNVGCVRAFRVMYPSIVLHHLCMPNVWRNNSDVDEAVVELANQVMHDSPFVDDWWFRFTSDLYSGRMVLLIGALATFLYGEVYLFLMMKSPFYVAWGSVAVLLTTATATGIITLHEADEIAHKETAQHEYAGQMRTMAWLVLIVGIVNGLLCLRLRKKVRIASQMMNEANKVLKESPGIAFVAPAMWVSQLALAATSFVVTLFVGSIYLVSGNDNGLYTNIARNAEPYHIKPATMELHVLRGTLQVLCIIVFTLTMGFLNIFGYNITCFMSVMWYFSAKGEPKEPPKTGIPVTLTSVRFHVGSYCIGAAVLTAFESIRGLLDKIQLRMRAVLNKINEINKFISYFTCLIQHVLLLFDKFLKLVRRDAFVIQSIEGTDFLNAAKRAESLYADQRLKIRIVAEVSETVALFGRLGILSLTLLTATLFLFYTDLGSNVVNPVTVMVISLANGFFIATLYAQITNSTMDSFLMCFCYDMDVNDGSSKRPYYTHDSFKALIDEHTEVRNEYRNIEGVDIFSTSGVQVLAREAGNLIKQTAAEAEQKTKAAATAAKNLGAQAKDAAIDITKSRQPEANRQPDPSTPHKPQTTSPPKRKRTKSFISKGLNSLKEQITTANNAASPERRRSRPSPAPRPALKK